MPNYWFHHIHLISPDPVKTAEFYEKMLGAKRVSIRERNGKISVNLDINGVSINVRHPRTEPLVPSTSQSGLEHFALRTDDIQAAVEELNANGAKILQEITSPEPGVKLSFFLAPGNVPIELLEEAD